MENKKTKVAMVIVIVLIIALIAGAYFYNDFNRKQMALLTEELNEILQADLAEYNIDFDIKTDKNYAEVEESIKEYMSILKNIYVEMKEMVSGINPDSIFSASNVQDKKMDEIDSIINEYKEKSQNFIAEYDELVTEKKITENINKRNISTKKDYYINLYNEVMLSETMQKQYLELEEEIKNEKARLYDKLNKIEKMKNFLKEHEDSWIIKENQIQFTSLTRMTEYYNIQNQIID